jgi:hypothetical protein
MNNLDHISESLETFFWVKILKFFYADPGWKKFGSEIRDPGRKKFRSGIRDKYTGSAGRYSPNSVVCGSGMFIPDPIFSIPEPGLTRSRIPNETFRIMGFAVSLSARKNSSGVRYSPSNFRPNRSYIFNFNLILPV